MIYVLEEGVSNMDGLLKTAEVTLQGDALFWAGVVNIDSVHYALLVSTVVTI